MEMKLELVAVPVSDVDRAKDFYEKVGFHVDYDHKVSDQLRFIQLTPPGSACSITIGTGIGSDMTPGSIKGLLVVVKDVQAAHDELTKRGIEVTDVEDADWAKQAFFSDPDGNKWCLQQPKGRD